MILHRRTRLEKGTTKTLYAGQEAGSGILAFEDNVRKNVPQEAQSVSGKGILANRISAHLMTCLENIGLPTHFIKSLNMREQQVKLLDPLPFIVTVRNVAAGSLVDRLGIDEGTVLPRPLLEFVYKKDSGQYAVITDDHILAFQWADPYELEEIVTMAYRTNDFLNGMFTALGVRLVDFNIEVGRLWGDNGELYLMLMDEFSPETMRLWDIKTNEKFYGHADPKQLIKSYQEIAIRLGIIPREGLVKGDGFNEKMAANLDDIENILANDTSRKIRSIHKSPPRKGAPWA